MTALQNLISQISVLCKKNEKIQELSGGKFNIFNLLKVDHYEITHSSIIKEFLDSKGSHGFKERFLEAFIKTLKEEGFLDQMLDLSLNNTSVIPEYSFNNGRIDLLITDNHNAIIIENKIYATDQFEQLKRYYQFGSEKYGNNFILLYLTLWGNESPEKSSEETKYSQISYKDFIAKWIEKCIEISSRQPIVRETLIQYYSHIKQLTRDNFEMEKNNEIIELLSKRDNLEAAFEISNNIDNVKNYIINKILLPQLKKVSDELNLILDSKEIDWFNTSWAGFVFKNPKWEYFKIATEFESKGLRNMIIGFNHIDGSIRNDEVFTNLKSFFPKSNQNWAFKDFPKFQIWRFEAMNAIFDGQIAEIFRNELQLFINKTNNWKM